LKRTVVERDKCIVMHSHIALCIRWVWDLEQINWAYQCKWKKQTGLCMHACSHWIRK